MSNEKLSNAVRAVDDFIEIRSHELAHAEVEQIAEEIKEQKVIKRFFINGSPQTDDGVSLLLEATKEHALSILNFTRTTINEPQAKAIAETLKQQPSLKRLHFESTTISKEAIPILADALKDHNGLEDLLFDRCHLDDAGAKAIANILPACSGLKDLRIYGGEIGNEGAAALANALPTCTKLESLNLTNNLIGDEGTTALAEAVRHAPSVSTLLLSRNEIGSAGFRALAESLEQCETLHNLNLGFSRGADLKLADFQTLVDKIALGRMATLDISHSGFNNGHRKVLAATAIQSGSHQLLGLTMDRLQGENYLSSHTALYDMCMANHAKALQANEAVQSAETFADAPLAELLSAHARLPAFKVLLRLQKQNAITLSHNHSATGKPDPDMAEKLGQLFLKPSSADLTLAKITQKDEQGFTVLDNPHFWKNIDHYAALLNQQGTPLTRDFLMQPGRDGEPALLSAVYSCAFKQTVQTLAQQGEPLGPQELLDNNSKPNALLQAIINENQLPALFCKENWGAQSQQALRKVMNALPEASREQVGNYHALLASSRIHNAGHHHSRG